MTTPELTCSDVHLRHTAVDGASYVQEHRVWDVDRFLAAQQKAARNVNAAQKDDGPRSARVDLIDRATYHRERARRG